MPVKFGARPRFGRLVLLAMNTGGFCVPPVAGRGFVVVVVVPAARCPLTELPVSVAAHVAFVPSRRALAAANWFWCSPLSCRSCVQAEPVDSMWSSSAVVYPGTSRCRAPSQLKAIASVVTPSTTPATLRTVGRWLRNEDHDVVARWATTASTSRGTVTPNAYARVTNNDVAPTRWWAAATEMAVRTGPAQGTKTRPRLSPSTNPPPSVAYREDPSLAKGRSMTSPILGINSPIDSRPSMATPSQNKRSSGRWRKLRTEVAKRTERLKLTTRPAMMT